MTERSLMRRSKAKHSSSILATSALSSAVSSTSESSSSSTSSGAGSAVGAVGAGVGGEGAAPEVALGGAPFAGGLGLSCPKSLRAHIPMQFEAWSASPIEAASGISCEG